MPNKKDHSELIGNLIQPFNGDKELRPKLTPSLSDDIAYCINYIRNPSRIKLFIDSPEKIYIFSPSILMLVTRGTKDIFIKDPKEPFIGIDDKTRISQIKFYPLKKTEYCDLKITAEAKNLRGATIEFKIDGKLFTLKFSDLTIGKMSECLEGILTRIVAHLPNIKD